MVDAARQRQGIGRRAVELLADELRAAGWAELETSFVPVDGGAEGFWRRCGFSDTGRIHDGEPLFSLALGAGSLGRLVEARDRTRAARAELTIEYVWEMPAFPQRRHGGLLRPLGKPAKAAGKWLLAAVTPSSFRRMSGEGVLDVTGRRYQLDYGSYARLGVGDEEWNGRSGRPISTLPTEDGLITPLWLFDALAGAVASTEEGAEDVRGTRCRHLTVKVDLPRASAATPGGVILPTRARVEDLLALPLEVWLDDSHVRRIRRRSEGTIETLELWDFDVRTDDFDWTCLPNFQTNIG
jgi:hypothetical protein